MLRVVLALFTVAMVGAAHARPPQLPVEEFFRKPEFAQMSLSPDGTHLAALMPVKTAAGTTRMNIVVMELDTRQPRVVTRVENQDVSGFVWATNHRLLFFMDKDGNESFGIWAVDRDGGRGRVLAPALESQVRDGSFIVRITSLLDLLHGDDDHVLVTNNDRNVAYPDVYRMNIMNGRKRMVQRNPGDVVGWGTDWEGRVVMAAARDGLRTIIRYRWPGSDTWETMSEAGFGEPALAPAGQVLKDGRTLYVASTLTPEGTRRDRAAIYSYDLPTRKLGELVFEHPLVDVQGVSMSRKTREPMWISYLAERPGQHFLDSRWARIQATLDKALPDTINSISSLSEDEKLAIVTAWSSTQPGRYYLFDVENPRLEELAASREWLKPEHMAPMQPVAFESRDGLTLHGYLTTPRGVEAKDLPLIVHPHGGPWARDAYGFRPEIQFLANRGYAVLQVNFRGSTGYGQDLLMAGNREWGFKMQDDVTDAVRWAIDQGIADGDRVCIYGASYGGYATMAGLAYTPELYRCGINYVGVTSIPLLFDSAPRAWAPGLETMKKQIGDPREDKAMLEDRSPVNHAERIQAPVFMAYGKQDPRVVIKHLELMEAALKRAGKPYEVMVKDDEGHGFGKFENQVEFYSAMERFLSRHLAPRSTQPAPPGDAP
ncbi:MAG TPA: S9 family peptidase [Xanthomonadaceae bacterium]|nr:S9 family peptidase [Xanthomonadaceae bacterium]